jgi:hypothetical protein
MRLESLLVGVVVLGFGILLVSTNGNLAGVNLPGLIGLPNCSSGTNSTCGGVTGFGGYSVGTVVSIFGLGLVANGLRAPATRPGIGGSASPSLPPEMTATLLAAQQQMMASAQSMRSATGATASPGVRYCSSCGSVNRSDSQFCHRCGKPMPPPEPPPKAPPPGPPPTPSPDPASQPSLGIGHEKR